MGSSEEPRLQYKQVLDSPWLDSERVEMAIGLLKQLLDSWDNQLLSGFPGDWDNRDDIEVQARSLEKIRVAVDCLEKSKPWRDY